MTKMAPKSIKIMSEGGLRRGLGTGVENYTKVDSLQSSKVSWRLHASSILTFPDHPENCTKMKSKSLPKEGLEH